MLRTIIELYDNEAMLNILAACTFKPENCIFVGDKRVRDPELQTWVKDFLVGHGVETEIRFCAVDTSDCSAIIEALNAIYDTFPDCAIEVAGGKYLMLIAAGMFAESVDVPIFHYDISKGRFCSVRDCAEADDDSFELARFTAKEYFTLAHAGFWGYGHISSPDLTFELRTYVRALWGVYNEYRRIWHRAVNFFQQADCDPENILCVNTAKDCARIENYCTDALAERLVEEGLITDLVLTDNRISFKYSSPVIRSILRDVGSVLELFTYVSLAGAPQFTDCEISTRIDWDGVEGKSTTTNEIDVVAVCGISPIFISCKTSVPNVKYLNEIYTNAHSLGGGFVRPVLLTSQLSSTDPEGTLRQRASDMDVTMLFFDDLCPKCSTVNGQLKCDCRFCTSRECEKRLTEKLSSII